MAQRFERKPETRSDRGILAAQYHAGQPLDDLRAVAAKADRTFMPEGKAVLAECALPDETVLVVRWLRVPDGHPADQQYEVIKDGDWLYYSETYESLGGDDTVGIEQFYDPVMP